MLSHANAAADHLVRPQSNSVPHITAAVNANATAVLTRSGVATRLVTDPSWHRALMTQVC